MSKSTPKPLGLFLLAVIAFGGLAAIATAGSISLPALPSSPDLGPNDPTPVAVRPLLTPAANQAQPYRIGQAVPLGDVSIRVAGIERTQGDKGSFAPQGQTYLVVHLEIENTGQTEVTLADGQFFLQNGQGHYLGAEDVFFQADLLRETIVPPGQKVTRSLVFLVGSQDSGLSLVLGHAPSGKVRAMVQLNP